MEPILRNITDNSWVFIVFLGLGVFLILLKFIFNKSFTAIGSLKSFKDIEENTLPLSLIINTIMGILVGIILYKIIDIQFLFIQNIGFQVLFIVAICTIFILFKFLVNALLSYSFNDRGDFKKIIRSKLYFRVFYVLFLSLITLALYFSNISEIYLIYGFITISILLFLEEFYHQITQGNLSQYISSYYFILYLCILEILPVTYIYLQWYR